MVERFNRRFAEALRSAPPNGENAGRNRFANHQERDAFITKTVDAYNRTRLKCLRYKAPLEMLNNLTEHNTKAGIHEALIWIPAFAGMVGEGRMRKGVMLNRPKYSVRIA